MNPQNAVLGRLLVGTVNCEPATVTVKLSASGLTPNKLRPMEVTPARQVSLAMRWIVQYADNRRGVAMADALAQEIKDAATGQGNAIKKREDTHKMAQANRAFAHFRW